MKAAKIAVLTLLLASISLSISYARDVFKSSDFLTWSRNDQEFYIRTSIGMTVLVLGRYDEAKAQCISNNFGADEQGMYQTVLDTMKRFPEYHPRGTLLAVLEKKCGKFSK